MQKTFEESLNELDAIVTKLEEGDMPLEESLEIFERGVKLARECKERLAKAERRIELLTRDSEGEFRTEEIGFDQ
jgi:exodeoxyribonuclease VII small subunit